MTELSNALYLKKQRLEYKLNRLRERLRCQPYEGASQDAEECEDILLEIRLIDPEFERLK